MEEFLAQREAARANTQLFGPAAVRKVETDMTGARTAKEDLGNWGGFGMNKEESEKQKEQRSHAKKQIVDVGFKNAALEQSRDRDDDRCEASNNQSTIRCMYYGCLFWFLSIQWCHVKEKS